MSPLCQMSMDKLPEWVLIGQRVGVVWQLWQCVHLRLYQLAFPPAYEGPPSSTLVETVAYQTFLSLLVRQVENSDLV